jgi:outer membrane cobalamin receptor
VAQQPAPQPAEAGSGGGRGAAGGHRGEAGAEAEEDAAIVVTGQRLRGAVEGDIPPEVTLNPAEIRAFGANTIAELITALAPQTSSGRGRGGGGGFPVILVNGRRISGFSEVRDLPPEAIERVDILPEEVALRYGYRADQRVVNLVLRERFNAVTAELEGGLATAGGRGVAKSTSITSPSRGRRGPAWTSNIRTRPRCWRASATSSRRGSARRVSTSASSAHCCRRRSR